MAYDMRDVVGQCVARYCKLAQISRSTLRAAATPSINVDSSLERGQLSGSASKIVMKTLYLARVCRVDMLFPVCRLARERTRWTVACDKSLLRLGC